MVESYYEEINCIKYGDIVFVVLKLYKEFIYKFGLF